MTLEKELQSKFGSEHQKAMVNLLYTGSWLYNRNASFLKPFGITSEQYNVLRILRGSHPAPLRLADIAVRMIERNSNCTRLVEKLRLKGLVTRKPSEKNRRQVDISITEKGLKLLARIDQSAGAFYDLMQCITRQEAGELNRILDKLRG